MDWIRGCVGEHRDLGRPGFGVNADAALEQPLRCHDVDVSWPGDQVDLTA